TTVFRTADRFTARHQEGSLIITLTGQDNKVKEIKVQDGRESNTYESVDKVPAAYRDKVKHLAEIVDKGNSRIEIPKPQDCRTALSLCLAFRETPSRRRIPSP